MNSDTLICVAKIRGQTFVWKFDDRTRFDALLSVERCAANPVFNWNYEDLAEVRESMMNARTMEIAR